MASQISALTVESLSVSFGDIQVLSEINLSLKPRTISSLVGPSGCGKTTFLMAVSGLLKDQEGAKIQGLISTNTGFESVGYVFQKPTPFRLSIFENVALALKERKVTGQHLKNKVRLALEKAGLWAEVSHRLGDLATNLSGGQQQRLCLARALALDPDVLLLDEPCSSLDPMAARKIEETLVQLSKTTTILIVTHNLNQAKRISEHTFVFWNSQSAGRLLEEGPTREIFASSKNPIVHQYLNGFLG